MSLRKTRAKPPLIHPGPPALFGLMRPVHGVLQQRNGLIGQRDRRMLTRLRCNDSPGGPIEVDTSLRAILNPGGCRISRPYARTLPENGVRALTLAERSAAYRERRKAKFESADRRTRP